MVSPEKKSGSILPVVIGVLVLAVIAVGAFLFLSKPQKEGLYVYYPKNAVFFMELEPGDELAENALMFYKNQEAKAEAVFKNNNLPVPEHSKGLADTIIAKDFTILFKPHLSLGSWAKEQKESGQTSTSVSNSFKEGHLLAVIPLRDPEMTLETLITKLEKTAEDFESTVYEGITVLTSEEDKELSLAIYDKNLMVTSGQTAMGEALDHIMGKEEHILNLAAHQTGLANLPEDRIATIVANYSELPAQANKQLQDIQEMVPYVYGAGRLEASKNMMLWDVYAPVFIDQVKNEKLQETVRGFLASDKNNFKAPNALPEDTQLFVSLGRVDDLINIGIEQYGKDNAEFQKQLAGAQFMLGMMEIDLKKDIIGFFHEEVVLAVRKGQGALEENKNTPMLLTADNTTKAGTLKKLVTVASGGMLPVQHKNEQVGDVSIDTFVAPGQPQRISVAQLGSGMIAVTDPVEMDALINVNKHQSPPLHDSALFKEITGSLPKTGITMFFMDMNNADEQVEGLAGTFDSEGEKGFKAQVAIKLKPGILTQK